LFYEAYESMALKEMQKLIEQAKRISRSQMSESFTGSGGLRSANKRRDLGRGSTP
jgi:hypothetical protein